MEGKQEVLFAQVGSAAASLVGVAPHLITAPMNAKANVVVVGTLVVSFQRMLLISY